ncbi:MAG: serine/threonine protein kinase [Deltaproteobacteria bacterium]|nr:serine/threonine protein kinase [Deltaproteobacteria bacterium]
MAQQRCPNCLKLVDVGIYVSGRRIRCPNCRVPFVVTREDAGPGELAPAGGSPSAPPRRALNVEAETTPSRPVNALRSDGSPFVNDTDRDDAIAALAEAPEIPGYCITSVIGQGAMGTVYRGTRAADGSVVALKVLAEKLQTSPEFVARFEREVAALKAVQHPCVVALVDHGAVGERRWFAMEYVEGTSLRAEYAVTHPVASRVVEILRQVSAGLVAAHDAGVVHRDLKPENVVVRPDGGVSIVDFGLAGLFGGGDPHPNLTRSRVTMGTVNYMAPEQRTDAKYVDQRADIYAVGVMLYEGFTGDLPVGRFQYPTERGLLLPKFGDAVLARALAKEPGDRYANARALLGDLDKLAKVLENTAMADTAPPRNPSLVLREQVALRRRSLRETFMHPRSRRVAAAVVALLLAAAIAGVGWIWWQAPAAYEVVVADGRAQRSAARAQIEGPTLGLVGGERTALETQFGSWSAPGGSVVHRAVSDQVHLQPHLARAVLAGASSGETLRVRLHLDRVPAPARARYQAQSDGFVEEARPDLPVRAGLGLALGGILVGGYIDSNGTCGYFRARGAELELFEQVCATGGDQEALLELRHGEQGLVLRVDNLVLPPQQLASGLERAQPALVCQNAECVFSAARPPAGAGKARSADPARPREASR